MRNIKSKADWTLRIIASVPGIGIVYSFIEKRLYKMEEIKSFWEINQITIWFFIALILFTAWFIVKNKELESAIKTIKNQANNVIPDEWKLKLGVYWDIEQNPYCAVCKTPVSQSPIASNMVYCGKCNKDILLSIGATRYPLNDAKEAIRKGEL